MIASDFSYIWNMFDELTIFMNTDYFIDEYLNYRRGNKLIHQLIEFLNDIFTKSLNIENYPYLFERKNLEKVIDFIRKVINIII